MTYAAKSGRAADTVLSELVAADGALSGGVYVDLAFW